MEENIEQIQQIPVQNPVSPTPIIPPVAPFEKINKVILIFGAILLMMMICIGFFLLGKNTGRSENEINRTARISPTIAEIRLSQIIPTKSSLDPKITWKSYINEKEGFSFKYPTDLIHIRLSRPRPLFEFCFDPDYIKCPFYVEIKETTYQSEVLELDKEWRLMKENPNRIKFFDTYEDFELSGETEIKGKKISGLAGTSGHPYLSVYFPAGERTFDLGIDLSPVVDEKGYGETVFYQILSTFKFLDQKDDLTFDWKIYEDEETGFLVKYPDKYSPKTRTNGVGFLNSSGEKIIIEKNFGGGWACSQVISSEEIFIDNEKGKLEIYSTMRGEDNCSEIDPNGGHFAIVFITHKGIIWFFRLGIEISREIEEIAEFKQVLSTFKFLP